MSSRTSKTLSGVWREIAGYKIIEKIGEGGMGKVYKGHSEVMGLAAIKVVDPTLMNNEKIKDRFKREAEAIKEVEHPNVVRILQWVSDAEKQAIVMEYLEGVPYNEHLDQVFRRNELDPPYPSPEATKRMENLRIMMEVAQAMSHVHRKGVCHRDLKPDNIIIVKNSVRGIAPKIIDFGICHPQGSPRRTQLGIIVGTPGYMAPEQITQGGEIDNRTDIYALGLILFESITGKSIFQGHSSEPHEQLLLMASNNFVAEQMDREGIPSHISPIIRRCLMFKREERYDFMDQVVGALDLAREIDDRYLINNINLLTKKKNQDDVVTLDDDSFELDEELDNEFDSEESTAVVSLDQLKQSDKPTSIIGIFFAALIAMVVIVPLVFMGYLIYFKKPNKSQPVTASKVLDAGLAVKKKAEKSSTSKKKPIHYLAVKKECEKITSSITHNPSEMIDCLRGKARIYYIDNQLDIALQVAKETEKEFWSKRNWKYRKEVKPFIRSVFRLLGRIYRRKASSNRVRLYGSEWKALSNRAAHYEQMVKNLKPG